MTVFNLFILLFKIFLKEKSPIITIPFELKENSLELLNIYNRRNEKLTIMNIESFYNYRTVEDNFKCVTSILSNKDIFMPINIPS